MNFLRTWFDKFIPNISNAGKAMFGWQTVEQLEAWLAENR